MSARPELNIDGFFDNIITSYETRIQKKLLIHNKQVGKMINFIA